MILQKKKKEWKQTTCRLQFSYISRKYHFFSQKLPIIDEASRVSGVRYWKHERLLIWFKGDFKVLYWYRQILKITMYSLISFITPTEQSILLKKKKTCSVTNVQKINSSNADE